MGGRAGVVHRLRIIQPLSVDSSVRPVIRHTQGHHAAPRASPAHPVETVSRSDRTLAALSALRACVRSLVLCVHYPVCCVLYAVYTCRFGCWRSSCRPRTSTPWSPCAPCSTLPPRPPCVGPPSPSHPWCKLGSNRGVTLWRALLNCVAVRACGVSACGVRACGMREHGYRHGMRVREGGR